MRSLLLLGATLVAAHGNSQGVTVSPVAPTTASPGQTFSVEIQADAQPSAVIEAIGGFALDFEITQGSEYVESISLPRFPQLNDTTRFTAVNADGVVGIVAGQFADVDGSNPALVTANPVDLFAVDITLLASAPTGVVIEVSATNPDPAGGVFVYPVNSPFTVLAVPNTPSSNLAFTTTTVQIETPCLADTNGDGSVTPADFNAWIAAFNSQSPACDQNSDGQCTPADFNAWISNFNTGC